MVENSIMEGLTALANTILAHPVATFGVVAGLLGIWKRAFLARLVARGRPKAKENIKRFYFLQQRIKAQILM